MGIDHVRLTGALRAILAEPATAEELPHRLCIACREALPVDGVGVSLMTEGQASGRMLLGASDSIGAQIEELQFGLGEGPCVSAYSTGGPVLVPDTRGEEARRRWPMFTSEAAELELGALFAFPLQVGTIGIGVLDCHRARSGPLVEINEALAVADAVTLALLNTQTATTRAEKPVDLFDMSWRNHAEVHQATGWLAAQLDIPVATALARLRGHAFRTSRPLHAVATDILAGTLTLPAEED
jgi:hypothetical protein